MTALLTEKPRSLWSLIVLMADADTQIAAGAWSDDLLPALRRGHIEVEEAFVAFFWPLLQSEVRRYGRIGGEADELTGEASLALWEAAVQYRPDRHRTEFSTYVKNHLHRRVRRAYLKEHHYDGSPTIIPLHPDMPDSSGDPFSLTEWRLDLIQAIGSLDSDDRGSLTPQPGTAPTRIRKRRQRARARLKAALLWGDGPTP